MSGQWCEKDVYVVWHDDKGIEDVTDAIKPVQDLFDDLPSICVTEDAASASGVKPILYLAVKSGSVFDNGSMVPWFRMSGEPFVTFYAKSIQSPLREGIGQTEGCTAGHALLFPMREVCVSDVSIRLRTKKGRWRRGSWVWDNHG